MLQQRIGFLATKSALTRFPDEIRHRQQLLDDYQTRMNTTIPRLLMQENQRLRALGQHLASLHPYAPLSKGFALIEREGRMMSAFESLGAGETVSIIRQQERAEVQVLERSLRENRA
jgi:exonuclease VII large subunit